jgi:hypothetical protein
MYCPSDVTDHLALDKLHNLSDLLLLQMYRDNVFIKCYKETLAQSV